ncbi:hypothetical protein RHSIM_Rhsim11G0078300 [Rhododendron simsii]|uniref:FAR1 domain-containing protein n=1 Tax=Rhododendron simsii TaxID=118357 RepID=A0A834G5U5_RHOSS|nr:hypothetical protein RHSIM_Rhsim11G0078300 [Rhododendron simsii]
MDIVSSLPSQMCQSSANSSQIPYIPQVKNDVIPKINQEFVSLEAVHKFYNNYGKEGGFGTREWSSRKNEDKVVVRKEYVCCKQGHWVPKKAVLNIGFSKRRRGIIREGCGAKLAVVRSKSGDKYVVSQFVEAYNHPLTSPGRTHLLGSHRKVTAAKRALAEQLSQANVPTCQQMSIFEVQAGGLENVGFGLQDLYNTERDIRSALLGQDADMFALSYKDHYDEFKQYIWNSESPEEFEAKWADVVQKANLSSNEWLKAMYEIYLNEKPQLSSSFPMESTMSELYTLAIFHKFQDQHYQIGGCMVRMTHEDEHNRFYTVERANVSGARVRNLLVNKSSEHVSYNFDDAVLTENGSELLEEALCSVRDKLCAMNLGRKGGNLSANVSHVPIPREHIFKESLQVRAKGYGQRLKRGKEKAVKKSRRCNGCGLTGQSHDKRNCPKLRNISLQDVRMSDEEEDDDDDNIEDESLQDGEVAALAMAAAVPLAVTFCFVPVMAVIAAVSATSIPSLPLLTHRHSYSFSSPSRSHLNSLALSNAGDSFPFSVAISDPHPNPITRPRPGPAAVQHGRRSLPHFALGRRRAGLLQAV